MENLERLIAKKLLKISAVKLQPANAFTWASGWKSPIYCDNRKTLSFPAIRNLIKVELSRIVLENFEEAKDHGLENLIEGNLRPGQRVVVIEDLISTGGSSLKAVEAIRKNGCEVIGMAAIFTYGFPIAVEKFKEANVKLITLSNYNAVLTEALSTHYITDADMATLQEWRKDPASWNPNK